MPLKNLVDDLLDKMRAFLDFPGKGLLAVRHEPDAKHVLVKILAGMQDESDNPHLMAYVDVPFSEPESFCNNLLRELAKDNEQHRTDLAREKIELPRPSDDARLPSLTRLAAYISAMANCFPDAVGAYVLILDPKQIRDAAAFSRTLLALVQQAKSDWLKLLVLDNRKKPALLVTEHAGLAGVLDFHLGPDRIEGQVLRDLTEGKLSWTERRQYLGLAGAFAAARGETDRAVQLQTQAAGLAALDGDPTEQANAWYNLGNTHLRAKQLAAAEGCFVLAAQICLEHQQHALLAMILSNLGVTLHRSGRNDEAVQALDTARRTFAALNNRPGEAYALDTKAAVLAATGRNDEAEKAWLEALTIQDGITSPTFAEVRAGGRADLLGKLERFYENTRQRDKLAALGRQGGPTP